MNNCELRKYIWLDFSKVRLLISPLIAIAISIIIFLSNNDPTHLNSTLMTTSGIIIGLFLYLWGAKQAADSITNEVVQNTWVFQRMSSVNAWDMTVGKLFGSTIYPWYSAAFFVVLYMFGAVKSNQPGQYLKYLVVLLLTAIIIHALAMIVCLITIRENRFLGRMSKSSLSILGLIVIYFFLQIIVSLFAGNDFIVTWFFWRIPKIDWLIISSLFIMIWAIIGVYRNMRTELQYENGPMVWCIFLFSLILYVNGMVTGAGQLFGIITGNKYLWSSYLMLLFILLVTIGIASFDAVSVRKLLVTVRSKDRKGFLNNIPLWLITIIFLIAATFLILINDIIWGPSVLSLNATATHVISILPISFLLFIIRDIAVIGLIKNSGSSKAEYYIAAYITMMYILLPVILNLAGLKKMLHVFWPIPLDGVAWQILPILVQVIMLAFLMKRKNELFDRYIKNDEKC